MLAQVINCVYSYYINPPERKNAMIIALIAVVVIAAGSLFAWALVSVNK